MNELEIVIKCISFNDDFKSGIFNIESFLSLEIVIKCTCISFNDDFKSGIFNIESLHVC